MTHHANGVEAYGVFFSLSAVYVCARPVHMYSNICSQLQYFLCLCKLYVRIFLVNGTAQVGSIRHLITIKHVSIFCT